MEALAKSQQEIGKAIEKSVTNFNKDSAERKTGQYANQRLAALKSQWELFEMNDGILQQFLKDNPEHSYFQNEYFGKIKKIAERYQEALQALLTSASGSKQTRTESNQVDEATKRLNTAAKSSRQLVSRIEFTERSAHYYQLQVDMLLRQKHTLDDINNMLWAEFEDYEDSQQQQLYEAVNEEVQDAIISLQELLEPKDKPKQHKVEGPTSAVKLPKITLPSFNGKYMQWIQFKELFTQLVHSQALSDTQKMFHLVTSLRDEASVLIQHLPVAARNYQPAWDLLCQRYDNKRLLVNGYLNKFTQHPVMQTESANSIKRLHDTTKECVMGLRSLALAVEHWDAVMVHLLLKKLSKTTHTLYEQSLADPKALDTLKNLLTFLETRFQSLEALNNKPSLFDEKPSRARATAMVATGATQCVICTQPHPLFACKTFKEYATNKRTDVVQKHNLCFNCLRSGHSAKTCDKGSCTKCNKKHNTLLHRDTKGKTDTNGAKGPNQVNETTTMVSLLGRHYKQQSYILLGTVVCNINAADGEIIECRALLDSGSQINGISERVAERLNLKTTNDPTIISGLGAYNKVAQKRAHVQITSPVTQCELQVEAFILPDITTEQPARIIDISSWDLPSHVKLADPTFNVPGPIDVLIGAEHYFNLIKVGRIELGQDRPALQNTTFGWIVSGKTVCVNSTSCHLSTREEVDLTQQLQQFWEVESLDASITSYTAVEKECEEMYKETVKRNGDGRFIVRLPFRQPPTVLGDSRQLALTRFFALEKKLERNPELRSEYQAFMREYLALGHMSNTTTIPETGYYLPHHCVIKPDSNTTKVRVVFDASAKTTTNIALNEILHTGPKIQEDLFSVLIRYRVPRFVCSADIEKMYRQIVMHEEDRKYQLILWRESPALPVQTFNLNTVTYGFTSAPFHAIRSLHELATEASQLCPGGANAIRKNMYVDDAMFGADSLPEALQIQQELIKILKSGGFQLRKWCANNPAFTKELPKDQLAQQIEFIPEGEHEVKTLGLIWLPSSDEFRIKVNLKDLKQVTKRQILSDIAHLFDPLGLIGPVVVTGKMILKDLWKLNLDWDDDVPETIEKEWLRFRSSLLQLANIKIQRHICAHKIARSRQLHVFCDASDKAYGAAAYVRSQVKDGTTIVRLLCAKSKIAPVKTLTTPRLELCAAKLGSGLAARVQRDLEWQGPTYFWTDSTIVLAWLRSPIASLHKFVANRISSIQELTKESHWRHVPSQENPADLISRGLCPNKLVGSQLWFFGPIFLHGREDTWPKLEQVPETSIERKTPVTVLTTLQGGERITQRLSHMSSITRIQRTIAYILRFIFNSNPNNGYMKTGGLSVQELEEAMKLIVREVQQDEFAQDINDLQTHRAINPKGKLASLDPRIDDRGILRVGGRLENANLPFEAKHQALLPSHHFITKLLMRRIHFDNKHVGTDALLAITRQKYWPINGKAVARSTVQRCVICAKHRPKMFEQIMGSLPSDRVQPARPFIKSGVNFCGPFYIRQEIRGRGPLKTYWAIFCCFATKAVHIEVVKNLTTDAFINALKRFTGRRGNCQTIYCDNATNFVGANSQLKELEDAIYSRSAKETINEFTTKRSIQFKFIPPRSPHFGGLWEAAVKSAKELLKKAIGVKTLTNDEFTTIAVEIEAILNSRPLTPLSSDPNDLAVLTPGHFLIGGPVNATADPSSEISFTPMPEMSKELAKIKTEFWERWRVEYLSHLQERHKWKTSQNNVKPGTMVIIKDDNLPVSSWPLGRIIKTIPGKDGKVRTAEIRSGGRTFTRVIHNLAPLPIDSGNDAPHTLEEAPVALNEDPRPSTSQPTMTEPTKKKRRIVTGLLATLLVLCCVSPTRAMKEVKVIPINDEPGLYFENLGSASLIKDEWTLIAYCNLTSFWRQHELITRGVINLQTLCSLVIQQAHCIETIEHFNLTLAQIATKNEFLQHNRRSRRSPLDLIGNVANSLFGVLDSKYAERMAQIITDLKADDRHILALIRNQTSIIDTTQNIISKSAEITHRQLAKMYQAINNTIDALNSINKDLDVLKTTEGFNALAIRLILTIAEFEQMQDLLINILVDTQHGKITPLLLSPQQLHGQIQLIRNQVPLHLMLPSQGESLPEFYQLMSVEAKITSDIIIFQIKLPLVSTSSMDLMSVTAVHIIRNNTMLRIIPSSPIMLVNIQEEQYYPITPSELLNKCPNYRSIGHLCRLDQSNINSMRRDSCELRLLLHKSDLSTCVMEENPNAPRWQRLRHSNKWLYTTQKEDVITTICDGQVSHISISGTGIIVIPIGCAIKDGTRTIESAQFINKVMATLIPRRNLSEVQFKPNYDRIEGIAISQTNISSELKDLRARIDEFKEATVLDTSISSHDIHQYSVSYMVLAIIILVPTGWAIWHRTRTMKIHPPVPRPRTSTVQPEDDFTVHTTF